MAPLVMSLARVLSEGEGRGEEHGEDHGAHKVCAGLLQKGTCSCKAHGGKTHGVSKVFTVHCGRIPGAQTCLKGTCPHETMGVECTISKLGTECWHLLVPAGVSD